MNLEPLKQEDTLALFAEKGSNASDQASRFLKSIAHRDRLRVLCCLIDQELSVGEIEAKVGASQSAISQHLGRLKGEGILTSRREGRHIVYAIADPTVFELITLLSGRFCVDDSD